MRDNNLIKDCFQPVVPPFVLVRADELVAKDLPPIRMVVGDVFPAGLVLLAGDPKAGKSLLLQHLAVCVATGQPAWGSLPVEEGDVLYISNEGGERSFRQRLMLMLDGEPAPTRLWATETKENLGYRLEMQLEGWLSQANDPRLVVIDTYSSVAPEGRGVNRHQDDYNALAGLADLASRYGDTLFMMVHHTRKAEGETDVMHRISGSQGMTAATDGNAVLSRQPAARRCLLSVRPRNAEECDLVLERHPDTLRWSVVGSDEKSGLSEPRQKVLEWLTEHGPAGPKDIASGTGLSHDGVRQLLPEMAKAMQVARTGRGTYEVPSVTAA